MWSLVRLDAWDGVPIVCSLLGVFLCAIEVVSIFESAKTKDTKRHIKELGALVSALNWTGSTDYLRPVAKNTSMKLIWRQNVPSNGTAVTVKLVTNQWSNDWAHPRDGEFIYNSLGRAMIYALNK